MVELFEAARNLFQIVGALFSVLIGFKVTESVGGMMEIGKNGVKDCGSQAPLPHVDFSLFFRCVAKQAGIAFQLIEIPTDGNGFANMAALVECQNWQSSIGVLLQEVRFAVITGRNIHLDKRNVFYAFFGQENADASQIWEILVFINFYFMPFIGLDRRFERES